MQERARRTEYPIVNPGALKSLSPPFHPLLWRIKTLGVRSDHGALLRSSEILGDTLLPGTRRFDSAELTYLATPVKSVLLLPSAEVNYSVRSPKLGASETRPYLCTTRFLKATICAQGTWEYRLVNSDDNAFVASPIIWR